jgi:phosphate ABC transporter phosphate-binding protein
VENKDETADQQSDPVTPPTNPTSGAAPQKKRSASGFGLANLAVVGIVLVAIGATLALSIYYAPTLLVREEKPATYEHLKVGGTSVVAVIAENRWKTAFRNKTGVEVDYESTGSSSGVNKLIDGNFAIAFTHAPLTEEQKKKAEAKGPVLHIPVLLCGVAPIYNVKELKDKPPMKFTGEVLAKIFLGTITKWDDKELQALNPELMPLPSTPIEVIHREDSSGTTYLLSEFLYATSKAWRDKYEHPSSEIRWEVGKGVSRSLGIALEVYTTEGAIGYVDRHFTSYDDMVLNYGAVKNEYKEKPTFVRAEPENLVAALQGAYPAIPEDLTFSLADKPGASTYPISGVVYAVCYQQQPESQRQKVSDFVHWITHEGQEWVKRSTYAPLPPELVARLDQRLALIKSAQ